MKNRTVIAAMAVMWACSLPAQAWQPDAGMTPQQVMQAASANVMEGKLPEANNKFAWLFDNASFRDVGEPGVPQAILLPEWAKLARHYPPARERLLLARERLVDQVAAGGQRNAGVLLTLAKVNVQLKDPASTRDAFLRLAARDPVLADTTVTFVLPAFVALQDFSLAGQYLTPPIVASQFDRLQRSAQNFAAKPPPTADAAMQRSFQRHTDLQLANIVLVLVNTGRRAEAEALVQRFRASAGSDAVVHHMTQALSGVTPPVDD